MEAEAEGARFFSLSKEQIQAEGLWPGREEEELLQMGCTYILMYVHSTRPAAGLLVLLKPFFMGFLSAGLVGCRMPFSKHSLCVAQLGRGGVETVCHPEPPQRSNLPVWRTGPWSLSNSGDRIAMIEKR
jgi:hypothetical protein